MILYIICTGIIITGAIFKWVGQKDGDLAGKVAFLVGNKFITFGFMVVAVKLWMTGHSWIATVPTLIFINGVIYDSMNTGKVKSELYKENDNES